MPQDLPIHPGYSSRFRCIGADCEDTCCQGWSVPIDQATWMKYQALPSTPLGNLVHESIEPLSGAQKPATFARIRMNGANQCPLWGEDGLCRVQTAYGEQMLSHTCATYPRIVQELDGVEEIALALSCPEAARLVLLTPGLLKIRSAEAAGVPLKARPIGDREVGSTDSGRALQNLVVPIRSTVLKLVQNRAYPLWQRLFLLGILCRRLDAIVEGELARGVPEYLAGFETGLAVGSLSAAMTTLPVDCQAQLDVVLRLAGMMLHKSNVGPRFASCVQDFTSGIGNGPGATLESLTQQYARSHERYYLPFFARHPHILENYLVNTIIRCRFPFGRELDGSAGNPSMTRESAMLIAQLTLIRGLLIGVAGRHRGEFNAGHVVLTIQAASRHFEHHPDFLACAHALLVDSGMDGARGLAILLREPHTPAGIPVSNEIRLPESAPPEQAVRPGQRYMSSI